MTHIILLQGSKDIAKEFIADKNNVHLHLFDDGLKYRDFYTWQLDLYPVVTYRNYNLLDYQKQQFTPLEVRMEIGIPMVIYCEDDTPEKLENKYLRCANLWGYKISLINLDPDDASWKSVKWLDQVIDAKDITNSNFWSFFEEPVVNCNKYSNLYVVGDLQGCKPHLDSFIANNSFDDSLVVFLGDLTDRGPDNVGTLLTLVELKKTLGDHMIVLYGNHDFYSKQYFLGRKTGSNTFDETFAEFEAYGFSEAQIADINSFYSKLRWYQKAIFSDANFVFTHGGISYVPNYMAQYPGIQYVRGNKSFGNLDELRGKSYYQEIDQVDEMFSNWSECQDTTHYSFHGHRNPNNSYFSKNGLAYNLESGVDKLGGFLSVVKISRYEDLKNGDRLVFKNLPINI